MPVAIAAALSPLFLVFHRLSALRVRCICSLMFCVLCLASAFGLQGRASRSARSLHPAQGDLTPRSVLHRLPAMAFLAVCVIYHQCTVNTSSRGCGNAQHFVRMMQLVSPAEALPSLRALSKSGLRRMVFSFWWRVFSFPFPCAVVCCVWCSHARNLGIDQQRAHPADPRTKKEQTKVSTARLLLIVVVRLT